MINFLEHFFLCFWGKKNSKINYDYKTGIVTSRWLFYTTSLFSFGLYKAQQETVVKKESVTNQVPQDIPIFCDEVTLQKFWQTSDKSNRLLTNSFLYTTIFSIHKKERDTTMTAFYSLYRWKLAEVGEKW